MKSAQASPYVRSGAWMGVIKDPASLTDPPRLHRVRPISVLRFWMSESLTQAES